MKKINLVKVIKEHSEKFPKSLAIIDVDGKKELTYKELYYLSGKVYNYLKQSKIGKNQTILISLPRNASPFICIIGAWRAGVAITLLEENHPIEKKEFIIKNCNCKLIIDAEKFKEIMNYESISGYERVLSHDLAYVLYTSGTTGMPKGIMHEFGTIPYGINGSNYKGKRLYHTKDKFLVLSPLNFTATLFMFELVTYSRATMVITSLENSKNVNFIYKIMSDFEITVAFFTPSLLRLIPKPTKYLKKIIIGGESAKNVFLNGVKIYSKYGQSEAGCSLCSFLLDKKYEDDVPIGSPTIKELRVKIIAENGKKANIGEIGEIVYKNPYFRGYLSPDQKAEKTLYKGYIRSGDLAKYLPNGDFLIVGRVDDMIKINGNRIDPSEIERAVKEVLKVPFVCVKTFEKEDRTYICAYYTDEPKTDISKAKELLERKLPRYMIPEFYMKIDEIPISENGKFKKSDLPSPDFETGKSKYSAPTNETEEKICKAISNVLDINKVGINDDFYSIGGDSVSTIKVLSILNLEGLDPVTMYRGRTPKEIAKLYRNSFKKDVFLIDKENEKALNTPKQLTSQQTFLFSFQKQQPNSTIWNVALLLVLDKSVDVEKTKHALEKVMAIHPVFSTVYYYDENNVLVQKYNKNAVFDVKIENVTEKEFKGLKKNLVQPHSVSNFDLYRVRLFKTEKRGYIFLDFHHSVTDGVSLHVFIKDVIKAYKGEELSKDYYYLFLEEREKEKNSELNEEAKNYYYEKLDKYKWSDRLNVDNETKENCYGNLTAVLPVKEITYEKIYEKFKVNKTALFISMAILALRIYNNEDNVKISWVFNGRNKERDKNVIGTLIKVVYVGVRFSEIHSLRELFKDIKEQMNNNIYYSGCSYPLLEKYIENPYDLSVIYQESLRDIPCDEEFKFTTTSLSDETNGADNLLDVEICEVNGSYNFYIDYNAKAYKKSTIYKFRKLLIAVMNSIVNSIDTPETEIEDLIENIKNNIS